MTSSSSWDNRLIFLGLLHVDFTKVRQKISMQYLHFGFFIFISNKDSLNVNVPLSH
jgi:hypothetical protein